MKTWGLFKPGGAWPGAYGWAGIGGFEEGCPESSQSGGGITGEGGAAGVQSFTREQNIDTQGGRAPLRERDR